jgi:hypothetical protein
MFQESQVTLLPSFAPLRRGILFGRLELGLVRDRGEVDLVRIAPFLTGKKVTCKMFFAP